MFAETIPALLRRNACDRGAQDAVVDHNRRISHAGLAQESAKLASWLVERGVNRNHRVGLLMENGVDWVVAACAIMRLGAALVPLSTLLRPNELAEQLAIAGVRHLIATPGLRGRDFRAEIDALDRTELPSLRNIWWREELAEGGATAASMAQAMEARVVPADDLCVIFTSGSSGAPKGIIHTQGAAIRAAAAGLEDRCIRSGTRLYLPMPLFWIGGFGSGLISAMVAGATLLTEAEPEPGQTLAFLEREHVTLFRGWPDQAARIAAHTSFPQTNLSGLTPGSLDAMLQPSLRAKPGARANVFGMTETFGPYAGYPLDRDLHDGKLGSCGRAFSGIHLRIVDLQSARQLAPGETGRIQIGGRNILRAICGREREQTFTPDGWYDSGDLGSLDEDGFLYFAGRADDMIKISGASVYPSEVERALETIPGVSRAFATAVEIAGAVQIGAAVVTELDASEVARLAKERLSAFKLPKRWAVVAALDALPHRSSGKIDRQALRTLLTSTDKNG